VIGVPSEGDDYAYLSCGTWSLLGVESPDAIITDEARRYNFTNEGGIDGTTRFLKNICGMWLFEQARKEFVDAPSDVASLAALCAVSDCDSIIDPDDASFAHPASMTAAIAAYCARNRQRVPETPADFVRVIFHSLADKTGQVLGRLRELSPVEINRLHVIGCGSRTRGNQSSECHRRRFAQCISYADVCRYARLARGCRSGRVDSTRQRAGAASRMRSCVVAGTDAPYIAPLDKHSHI